MSKPDNENNKRELAEIAEKLATIEVSVVAVKNEVKQALGWRSDALSKARQHYRGRRKREALFGNPNLFGEPAWDILVDLFIAAEEGKKISVSSLCIASAAPMTTGLRWIAMLESDGLIERAQDPDDNRRFFLSLSPNAHERMKAHFDEMGL